MSMALAVAATGATGRLASRCDGTRGGAKLLGGSLPAISWRIPVPLDPNGHQGLYGESYVYMLAGAAGLTASRQNLDFDGVDWQFAHPGAAA
jgi:hypothetical protein